MANFTGAPIGFAQEAQEQKQIDRARQYAQMLMKDTMQPTQGQMVSGRFVAPSWTQHLNKLAEGYYAGKLAEISDKREAAKNAKVEQRMLGAIYGSPSTQGLVSGLRGEPQGLDLSQLNDEEKQALYKEDPQAFARGVNTFRQTTQPVSIGSYQNLTPEMQRTVDSMVQMGDAQGAMKYMADQLKPHVTADGRAVSLQGGQMRPVAGSLGTYGAFQDVGERSKAGYDVLPKDMWPRAPDGGLQPQTRLGMVGEVQGAQPQMPQVVQQGQQTSAQGLDISKLSPQQQQFLMNRNPAAFSRGVQSFQQTQGMPQQGMPQREMQQGMQPQVAQQTQRPIQQGMPPQGGMSRFPSPEQQAAATIQAQVQPTANLEYAKGQAGDFAKQYSTVQSAGIDASNKIARLDRLSSLIGDVQTGKLTPSGTNLAAYAQSVGLNVDPKLGNKQAAQALMGEMALQLRNPSGGAGMPGAMSDKDREFLQAMSPSLANTPQGNKMIIETARKLAQRDRDVAELARNYNGGRLDNGFYQVLQDYANKNPLFPQKVQQNNQLDSLLNKYAPR